MRSEVVLETKLVGDITGKFIIPSYQRGYRWGETEVVRLLEDIYLTEGKCNYCLQPIVVRNNEDKFELIDGQQRLTTIYLIYYYMRANYDGFPSTPKFTISYEYRKKSEEFLQSIDACRKEENIDFWFMVNAYETISKWFESKGRDDTIKSIDKFLRETVKIIWYEVDENEDAISLFTRLNIGKIPLTNAELVKAMFLRRDKVNHANQKKKEEIAYQWDHIEKELHNDKLWYFLTNATSTPIQTRIDLILDLIAEKPKNNRDEYFTFFKFDEMQKSQSLDEIWNEILKTSLLLKDWFSEHELYHKIGYLIASEASKLCDIYEISKLKTKKEFVKALDELIKRSVHIEGNYVDLSYKNSRDCEKLYRLLLLFNVETVRCNDEHAHWFPFEKYKITNSGRTTWSLEHIHAQNSEGLRTMDAWKTWLKLQLDSVKDVKGENYELAHQIEAALDNEKLTREEFESLHEKVINILTNESNIDEMHSISNLALLSTSANSALSNSTFDVKRNQIIEMDKKGQFIPFCTRMVFLKYYTPSCVNQLHFWASADRKAYIENINRVLADKYLDETIIEERET